MSIKGLLQALFWCSVFMVCFVSWFNLRDSYISSAVLSEYHNLPENCGARSRKMPCNFQIDSLNATDVEKFWLKHDLLIFIIVFWIFIFVILWMSGITRYSPSIFSKETENPYLTKENHVDEYDEDLEIQKDFHKLEEVQFDWNEKPFEYKQSNIL